MASRVVASTSELEGGMSILPVRERHARPEADRGLNRKVVHEPARSAQSQAETAPGAEAVAEGLLEIRDAGSLIVKLES